MKRLDLLNRMISNASINLLVIFQAVQTGSGSMGRQLRDCCLRFKDVSF